MVKFVKPSRYTLFLCVLLMFHLVSYFAFRSLDKSNQTWDSAGHLGLSMRFSEKIADFVTGAGNTTLLDILKLSNYYPPAFHIFTSFFNFIFGYSSSALLFIVFLMFLFSIVLAYRIVRVAGFSERVAFFTAFFYSLFPQVADQARLFHLEIPLIFTLLICFYTILTSKGFTDGKRVVLVFMFFGIAQLIKWYSFVFLAVPVVAALIVDVENKSWVAMLKKVCIGGIAFLIIALPWYLINLKDVIHFGSLFTLGETDDPSNLFSFANLTFYPKNILSHQIYLLPFILAVTGLITFIRRREKVAILLFLHLGLGYLIFTFISNKNLRYLLPFTPIYAFLIGYFLNSLPKFWCRVSLSFIVLYVVWGFLFSTFNQVSAQTPAAKIWGLLFEGPFYKGIYYAPQMYSYDTRYTPIKEILYFVVRDARWSGLTPIGITPLIDSEEFSVASLELVRLENRFKDVYLPVPYLQFDPFKSTEEVMGFFNDAKVTYVLVPEHPGPEGLRNYRTLKNLIDFMNSDKNVWFRPLETFDGLSNNITVFKRVEHAVTLALNSCEEVKDFSGEVKIDVAPGNSYVIFTGHFGVKGVNREFEPNTLRVLELGNIGRELEQVIVGKLPVSGVSVCYREGVNLDLGAEIGLALTSPNSCGEITCEKVIHTRVTTNGEVEEVVYTKESLPVEPELPSSTP